MTSTKKTVQAGNVRARKVGGRPPRPAKAAAENLNQLRFLQEDAQQTGNLRVASYQDSVQQHVRLLRSLDMASHKMSLRRLE